MLVPGVVRNKALAAGATAWLDGLPGLIAGLERDRDITVGRPFLDATEAFVAEAAGPGPGAVPKLMIPCPGDHARNEITVLRLAGGEGCVRLLRAERRPLGPRPLAGPALCPRHHGDLGVGRGGAGVHRPAVHPDRPSAGRPRDARHR